MKALLIKDLRLIFRQQRATLFMFLAVVLLITGATENPMFGILYTVFLLPALLISTIAYDAFDNGMPYIMALPVSVKEYVAEKYALTVGGAVIVNIFATVFTTLVQMVKGGIVNPTELLVCAFTAQSVILIYSAIALPVNMRYGTEKGRMILIIMAVAVGALFGSMGSLPETGEWTLMIHAGSIWQLELAGLFFLILIACIAVNAVSYYVCVKWIKRKEY